MPGSKKKYEKEGLVRVEIDMDFKTYAILLALVEQSGYKVGKKTGQTTEGIRGVLTQGILELYQKYVEDDEDDGLDKINQQAYIFANRVIAMRKNEIPKEKVISTLQSKLPVYLKNSKIGKLIAEVTMKKFLVASTFSTVDLPELTPGMKQLLKKKKILELFK